MSKLPIIRRVALNAGPDSCDVERFHSGTLSTRMHKKQGPGKDFYNTDVIYILYSRTSFEISPTYFFKTTCLFFNEMLMMLDIIASVCFKRFFFLATQNPCITLSYTIFEIQRWKPLLQKFQSMSIKAPLGTEQDKLRTFTRPPF